MLYIYIMLIYLGLARSGIMVDIDYDGFSVRDLADSSLQTWVHHSPAILPQVKYC